jgi:N-acetylglucosaminyldiphosphoundecaprenol N-acetyl-beta-D-mannosaminyltransferase
MPDSFHVLGVRIDTVQIREVLDQMRQWILSRRDSRDLLCHYIAVTNIHGITESLRDPVFKRILDASDLCVPDGMPVIWLGRHRGHRLTRRVYGPDVMMEFCSREDTRDCSHFFYGGAPGVAEELAATLTSRFPGLRVGGTCSPPFRPLTPEEDEQIVAQIKQAAPDVLWVGLGCPKQEIWMYEHRDRLAVPVMIGVGQAFDIHAGKLRQAPLWMREHGLEWFFRICLEPRRLLRRYVVNIVQFAFNVALESLGMKTFAPPAPRAIVRSTRSGA